MELTLDTQAILQQQIREGKALTGKDGALAPLIKQLTEAALQGEIESHLTQDLNRNRKNGTSSKTMKSDVGNFELDVPRDRNGSFEPEIEKKILSLYALGNSYTYRRNVRCRFL